MSTILLVDDSLSWAELIAARIEGDLGHEVALCGSVAEISDEILQPPPDLALIDLSFAQQERNGLDALMRLRDASPTTLLMVLTQGDSPVAEMLRDAWELFPLATAWSKAARTDLLLRAIETVLAEGTIRVDPALQPLLPAERRPWRNVESYSRLVRHIGHARLWAALIVAADDPSYRDLAELTGLSINTVRNYRTELLGELAFHDLDNPPMHEMQDFARRSRPFLEPYMRGVLDELRVR